MSGGVLQYKCRKCGEMDESSHVPDVGIAIVSILVDGNTPRKWGAVCAIHDLHHCRDGVIGITDLIAGKNDPIPEGDK